MNNKPRPHTLGRILKSWYKSYPLLITISIIATIISAAIAAVPDILLQKVIKIITEYQAVQNWEQARSEIAPLIIMLAGLYVFSILLQLLYTQLNAYTTQGYLCKMRKQMFNKMQNLPLRYFDQNKHGDIMSRYTNDVDSLREFVAETIPAFLRSSGIVIAVFSVMIYYSFPLTGIILIGVGFMLLSSKIFGGRSSKHFMAQQKAFGAFEGYVQEMMSGQKVIKVFNYEERAIKDFVKYNNTLCDKQFKANAFANSLGPVIMNIGNILYVILAIVGGYLLLSNASNLSLATIFAGTFTIFTIDMVVPFLNMTRQFTGNVNQLSQQLSYIVFSLAGASRVFELIDEESEVDNGYVTLVDAEVVDGEIHEVDHHTGIWAWKHPHQDGTLTYSLLKGDVTLNDVDFAYVENKPVLHNITLYAKPGQKVAFVGATGAGKTTITNLLNRFYDIADGKIRYDGININKIKKGDLRRSLGLVLQDTNLFTGTVMDNIRYGKLEATDEECIAAAKLAGADDFITRLPQGYETVLTNNGTNLSQGQRQLIAIARCAVADPPVMILDEATSSIDTRTESIVQKGMDSLMKGRTTFVIAHRLSTVMNSDVIMVLDHGRIIERGTHEDLIKQHGTYYQLYTGAFELE